MRAYHRVDPLMDERKSHYSPAQFGAFMKVQLVAGRQSEPGTFRSLQALRDALPGPYGRHLQFMVDEGDVVVRKDGRAVVDGWKEWQEGDLTVAERMKRLRERKRHPKRHPDTPTDTAPVTPPVTPNVTDEKSKPIRTPASPAAIGVGVSSSVSSGGRKKAPTIGAARANGSPSREPRLTRAQLDSWSTFTAAEWQPFREAWIGRGLRSAPAGAAEDDDTSQRGLLWQIAEARPNDLGHWVREAPGRTAREVVDHVIKRWHQIRHEVGEDEAEAEETQAQRRRAPARVGTLLETVVGHLRPPDAEPAR